MSVEFQLKKYPTNNLLYNGENLFLGACLKKRAILVCITLNTKELHIPTRSSEVLINPLMRIKK